MGGPRTLTRGPAPAWQTPTGRCQRAGGAVPWPGPAGSPRTCSRSRRRPRPCKEGAVSLPTLASPPQQLGKGAGASEGTRVDGLKGAPICCAWPCVSTAQKHSPSLWESAEVGRVAGGSSNQTPMQWCPLTTCPPPWCPQDGSCSVEHALPGGAPQAGSPRDGPHRGPPLLICTQTNIFKLKAE